MPRFESRYVGAFAVAFLFVGISGLVGCSSDGGSSAAPCQEGRSVACTCSDGREGSQVCQSDGSWGRCQCDGSDAQSDTDRVGADSELADAADGSESEDVEADGGEDAGPDGPRAPFALDAGFADPSWLETADLDVVKVTNLENSGEGSLPWAVEQAGPKVIVFEVGGAIDMEGQTYLRLRDPQTYIAGQTAPSPGITLNRAGMRIHADETIVQHLRVRVGDEINDPHKARSFTFDGGVSDVIIDHVSGSWHTDEGVAVRDGAQNSTFSNSLIAEGLCDSPHPEELHCRAHNFGCDVEQFASLGNVYSDHRKRHPYGGGGTRVAWVNNYIYNHGFRLAHLGKSGCSGPATVMSFVGNVYEMGADSPDLSDQEIVMFPGTVYYEDNISIPPGRPATGEDVTLVDDPPLWPDGLDALPSGDVKGRLLQTAGARPADRSATDQRMIDEIRADEGTRIDSQDEVGGYPELESTQRSLDVPDTDLLDWLAAHARAVEQPGVDRPN